MQQDSGFGRFVAELRRRRVVRTGGVYAAAAFVILQAGEIILPAFDTPPWALQLLVVFAALGLPVVLAFAWVYDITPQGLQRTADVDQRSGRVPDKSSFAPRLALLVITILAVGTAGLWFVEVAVTGPNRGAPDGVESFVSLEEDSPITAVAVLPLDDFSQTDGSALFVEALHEELIDQLIDLTSLRVVSRTTTEGYANTDKTAPQIAQELRVQGVIEGSIQRSEDSVRINVRLIHAPSETQRWRGQYQRSLEDEWSLQSEVAREIAIAIQGETAVEEAAPVQVASVDPKAYEQFLMGQQASKLGTSEGLETAIDHFSRAVELDDGFGPALAELAGTRVLLGIQGDKPLEEVLPEAHAEAVRALELDQGSDEARAVMITIGEHLDGIDPTIRDAIAMAGVEADSLEQEWVAQFTEIGRRTREVMAKRQGPRPPPVWTLTTAQRLMAEGQFDDATVLLTDIIDEDPNVIPAWDALERTYVLQGDYEGAVEVRSERIIVTQGESSNTDRSVEALHTAYEKDGAEGYWQWLRKEHSDKQQRGEYASDVEYAAACVALGDYEDAIRALERGVENRDRGLITLRSDPIWDPLRDDPRFRSIANQVRKAVRSRPPMAPGASRERNRGANR